MQITTISPSATQAEIPASKVARKPAALSTNFSRRSRTARKALFLGLLSAGLLLAGLTSGAALQARGWLPFGNQSNQIPIYVAADAPALSQAALSTGFASVAKMVTPAVVTVQTSSRARPQQQPFAGDPFGPFGGLDPFRDFFRRDTPDNNGPQQPRPQAPGRRQGPDNPGPLRPFGLGSGVLVSPDGYVMTNNHVVENAEKVEVTLPDRRSFTAKVVGTDPPSDIAVLKIEGATFPTITLGDSNRVEIGDVVLAVGNPLGVGQTVTMGIISAKGRSTRNAGSGSYEDFLQTDAAINHGNSGGALVNLKGELIGIPTQILSQSGGSIGIGFAIPTVMARNVMDQLLRNGKVQRGKLGVSIGDLSADLATQFKFKGTQGALVQDVEAGQPAERAGIKPGDIITEYQGQRIDDSSRLRNLVAQSAPGSTVKFKLWRDGSERELTATLAEVELKTSSGGALGKGGASPSNTTLAGIRVENLTAEMARSLNLAPTARGVVITEIDPNSGAAQAGLQRGEVIEEINRQAVANVADFNAALQKAGQNSVLLRVRRAEGARFVVVQPRE